MRLLKREKRRPLIEFSESTGRICDAACLAERTRERNRTWALTQVR